MQEGNTHAGHEMQEKRVRHRTGRPGTAEYSAPLEKIPTGLSVDGFRDVERERHHGGGDLGDKTGSTRFNHAGAWEVVRRFARGLVVPQLLASYRVRIFALPARRRLANGASTGNFPRFRESFRGWRRNVIKGQQVRQSFVAERLHSSARPGFAGDRRVCR